MNDKTSFIGTPTSDYDPMWDKPVKPLDAAILDELEKLGELPPQGLTPEKLGQPESVSYMSYAINGVQRKLLRLERVTLLMTGILHVIKGIEKHAKDADCYPWTADKLKVTVFERKLRVVVHSHLNLPNGVVNKMYYDDHEIEEPEEIQDLLTRILGECCRKNVIVEYIDSTAIFDLVDHLVKAPRLEFGSTWPPMMIEPKGESNED